MTDETKGDGMTLEQAAAEYDAHMQSIGGCHDGGCVILKPKGMHTNGGCRCPRDYMKMQRLAYASIKLRRAIDGHLAAQSAMRVDDAMVDRALNAKFDGYRVRDFNHTTDNEYDLMRAALQAALAKE